VMAQPLDNLSIGASVRPPVPIRASGNLSLELGEFATKTAGAKVSGDQAELFLTLPLEVRVGAHFKPIDRLGLNADFVYQGWQSVHELVLTPKDVNIELLGAKTQVDEFRIPKNWNQSFSFRLGASFDIIKYLTVQAGFLYETGATPDTFAGIDFLHFDRFFLTGGLTAHVWKLDLLAGMAFTPTVTRSVVDSEVRAGSTTTGVPGQVVGAGIYESGGWVATFGVRGHFGGSASSEEPHPPSISTSP
jgi:long-subunit fatty acid transport protein